MAKDSLSALLDGECSAAELSRILDEMERSPELGQTWSRLCLARDAAEGVHVRRDQSCICAGVMGSLDRGPVSVADKVVPIVRRRVREFWKPVVGLALAASVGAIAVTLNMQGEAPMSGAPGIGRAQLASEVSLPVAQRRPRYLQTVSTGSEFAEGAGRTAMDDELRNFLIQHSSTLAGRGMGATLPYARFAAHSVGDPAVMTISADMTEDQP